MANTSKITTENAMQFVLDKIMKRSTINRLENLKKVDILFRTGSEDGN